MNQETENRWLVLFHQMPPKPAYFRVKIWRRLQSIGAVAIKNSVYALPKTDQAQEDLQWTLREITEGGGEASLCEARFIDGLSDEEIEALFRSAREADYKKLTDELRKIAARIPASGEIRKTTRQQLDSELPKLKTRLSEIIAIDFFGAPGRESAEGFISGIEARMRGGSIQKTSGAFTGPDREDLHGKMWVTRKGIYVDRIASAWLVRRFIDSNARFKFVPAKGYKPLAGEVRFDMFEAEFTHEGDRCTLEVMINRMGLVDPALKPIEEIVHDIDLKDSKFKREETIGIERLISGIAMAHKDDDARLARGSALFDDLYEYFKRKHD